MNIIEHIIILIIGYRFMTFDLEAHSQCRFDYVDVFDGPSLTSPPIGRFCGSTVPDMLKSTGPSMLVNFVSDWSVSRAGFTAGYRSGFGE